MSVSPRRTDAAGDPLRLMHVHAHPDDESSKGAASTAMYVEQGVEVLVATCTGGERGSILNPAMDRPDVLANITRIRADEMAAARAILGVDHVALGWVDSGLPEGDPLPPLPEGCFALEDVDEAAGRLVKAIREFRPHVLTTYDENGGYPHPDHIMCHRISMAAVDAAADPEAWPEHGPAWQVQKVYYHAGFSKARFEALDQAMTARGLESPYAERLANFPDDRRDRATCHVECGDYFETRDRALLAHATQIDPNGFFFAVPLEVQQEAWPTEEYELVRSEVGEIGPEDDLFTGIAVEAASRAS
ncbi:mycothiol conjugate amidase Mca [Parenemella sanctibonifatiensis]|uniref:Mycothiol S-conjugate amidase n=1 Tax=Parenemella sanctibonifatiensis TaxID=2016505 RepID=A0A255ERS9_9ACTN|nr:mycothiol conjugate amidase Mca [Parenemella sanctibonifatiensis]OYN92295.1 mycothiol conjugate amidase Mca [Parenemella sanctibonifatiensis]